MLDLSLSDALTDGVPQASPESRVERDFVAQLEAEPFEDEVGETVGKTDYIPLLDNDDNRAGCFSITINCLSYPVFIVNIFFGKKGNHSAL
uniref:Uncharacterized protein n=1 Tax=Periophthalmus magnuspinnatus TaxID=409849 RepID=A0A3B4BFJ8_9GOBI